MLVHRASRNDRCGCSVTPSSVHFLTEEAREADDITAYKGGQGNIGRQPATKYDKYDPVRTIEGCSYCSYAAMSSGTPVIRECRWAYLAMLLRLREARKPLGQKLLTPGLVGVVWNKTVE